MLAYILDFADPIRILLLFLSMVVIVSAIYQKNLFTDEETQIRLTDYEQFYVL